MEKTKKNQKTIDKKENKIRRIATALVNKELRETIKPTRLAMEIGIHYNTLIDILDLFDGLKEIGFKTIRDKNGKVMEIIRTDENLNTVRELREIRKEQLDQRNILDEIKIILGKKKK